jgi:hypothetical protein
MQHEMQLLMLKNQVDKDLSFSDAIKELAFVHQELLKLFREICIKEKQNIAEKCKIAVFSTITKCSNLLGHQKRQ